MDAGAFLQENKRWLMAVALGGIVYWIASGVIASTYDVDSVRRRAATLAKSSNDLYDQKALDAAQQEQTDLQKQLQQLRHELEFRPEPKYVLQGQEMAADDYLLSTGRQLRERLQKQADAREVQLIADKALSWPNEASSSVLVGLGLLDQVATRLFAAHDLVRKADEHAPGLVAITELKVDEHSRQGGLPRQPKPGTVAVGDLLDEEKVEFAFQSDAPTLYMFLERCRQPGSALVLERLTMTHGNKADEPMTVRGAIRGIVFKEQKQ